MSQIYFQQIELITKKKIITSERVYGGDINSTTVLTFDDKSRGFLKWNGQAPESMFETEAKGLEILNSADSDLAIPKPIHYEKHWFLMEFMQETSSGSDMDFGINLAKLHKNTSDRFGLDHNNFIGPLPQYNSGHNTWADFYFMERILPQIEFLEKTGKSKIEKSSVSKLKSVIEEMYPKEAPALLHGDLWSGNYFYTNDGKTSIFDPAVYYGHREMDLAMSRLFGGFSSAFYEGYNSEYPLAEGSEDRLSLSQLYPILVHANLFGGHYVQSVHSILKKYI